MDIAEDPGMAGTDVVPHGPSAANTRDVLFWDDHEPERWSSIVNPSIYRMVQCTKSQLLLCNRNCRVKKRYFLFPLVEMLLSPKGTKPLEEF